MDSYDKIFAEAAATRKATQANEDAARADKKRLEEQFSERFTIASISWRDELQKLAKSATSNGYVAAVNGANNETLTLFLSPAGEPPIERTARFQIVPSQGELSVTFKSQFGVTPAVTKSFDVQSFDSIILKDHLNRFASEFSAINP